MEAESTEDHQAVGVVVEAADRIEPPPVRAEQLRMAKAIVKAVGAAQSRS